MNTQPKPKTSLRRLAAEEAKANMREAYTADGRLRSLSERHEAQKQTASDAPEAPQYTQSYKALQQVLDDTAAQRDELLAALKGVAWKIQAYGSHWEPSQAEREAIATAIANAEKGAPRMSYQEVEDAVLAGRITVEVREAQKSWAQRLYEANSPLFEKGAR